MAAQRVPPGVKLALWVVIYLLIFFITTPSVPMSKNAYNFWNGAAAFFGDDDVEGFIGIALISSSAIITTILLLISIKVIERILLSKN